MEPPVGYGLMDRSIFPESQFGTVTLPSFGGPSWQAQTGSMPLLIVDPKAKGVARDNGGLRTLDTARLARPRNAGPVAAPLSPADGRDGPRSGSRDRRRVGSEPPPL